MGHRRLHYIDWLRALAVLLLFPFHTWRVFNFGDPFYVKSAQTPVGLSWVIAFIDRWHMPLLFVLAGMSTYLALGARGVGEYAAERVKRLLVPFVFGLFVLVPPQTWLGARFHGGYAGSFVQYLASGEFVSLAYVERTGTDYYGGLGFGHLWFILYLFLISLVVLPVVGAARSERGRRAVGAVGRFLAHPAGWLVVALALWFTEGPPDPIDKHFFMFVTYFLLGFAAVSSDEFAEAASRRWWWNLGLGLVVTVWYVASVGWRDALPDPSWALAGVNVAGMFATWAVIVGLLGCGRRFLDRPSRVLSYAAESSYPVYLLHQTVIVCLAFLVVQLPFAWQSQWTLLLVGTIALTFALLEVVRRVSVLRFCFGMRGRARG